LSLVAAVGVEQKKRLLAVAVARVVTEILRLSR
jgi:hypothetical protein